MLHPRFILKRGQWNPADLNNGGDAVRETHDTLHHGIDALAQLTKFRVSSYVYPGVKIARGNGIHAADDPMDATNHFLPDKVIQ